jgi:multicomponent Na+:H+ antiporter subunit D
VLVVGSLLAVAYLMPIPVRAFLRPPAEPPAHGEAAPALVGPLTLTALGCVLLFVGAGAVVTPLVTSLGPP